MLLDEEFINDENCDSIKIHVLDNVGLVEIDANLEYSDGDSDNVTSDSDTLTMTIKPKDLAEGFITFSGNASPADVVIVEVSYLKGGKVVGSHLRQSGSDSLKHLKYKVELPRGAKVTLFDDDTLEAQFVSWELPCPNTLPNMTFLQVKAANGFEQQITPSAGSYSVEVWTELGRRYAVFGEIWTYSFAQTLWFADLKVQLSNYDWVDVVPTAGEGGTIVTALPQ